MYAGCILESAPTGKLFTATAHPYTKALISSVPKMGNGAGKLFSIPGSPPDAAAAIAGCPFFPRCSYGCSECTETPLRLLPLDGDHATACVRAQKGTLVW